MNTNYFLLSAKAVAFTLLTVILISACSSSTGHDEDELEPVGLVVRTFDNNQNGDIVAQYTGGSLTGEISVPNGATSAFNVFFVAPDGTEFTPEPEEHSVTHELAAQQQVASVSTPSSPVGPYEFSLTGQAEGSTTLTISLLHVGETEFVSPQITVTVTAAQ